MGKPRRNRDAVLEARVALEAIKGEKTIVQIAAHHEVHPNPVATWRTQVLENLTGIFGDVTVAPAQLGEVARYVVQPAGAR